MRQQVCRHNGCTSSAQAFASIGHPSRVAHAGTRLGTHSRALTGLRKAVWPPTLKSSPTALQPEKSVRAWTASNGPERSRPTVVLRGNGKPCRGPHCIDRDYFRLIETFVALQ